MSGGTINIHRERDIWDQEIAMAHSARKELTTKKWQQAARFTFEEKIRFERELEREIPAFTFTLS